MKTKFQIDPLNLTNEQRDKLDAYNAQQKQLQILQDIADMTQEMLMGHDKEQKKSEKTVSDMGSLLMDMRESLDAIRKQEAPDTPDFSKPVVEALVKLQAELKKIDTKPVVKVDAPKVNVTPPSVDLKGVEKILKTDIPKAFQEAIKLIPETPEPNQQPLLDALNGLSEQLLSIETATRMKPVMPSSIKVTNVDGSAVGAPLLGGSNIAQKDSSYYGDGLTSGIGAVAERYYDGAAYNRTPAAKILVDKSTTTNVIYIGKAPIGTTTSTAGWQIKKIDKTVTDNVTITHAAAGAFTATWNNRGSETYS